MCFTRCTNVWTQRHCHENFWRLYKKQGISCLANVHTKLEQRRPAVASRGTGAFLRIQCNSLTVHWIFTYAFVIIQKMPLSKPKVPLTQFIAFNFKVLRCQLALPLSKNLLTFSTNFLPSSFPSDF